MGAPPVALSRPLKLRGVPVRNRLVMAPMCAMYAAPDGSVTPQTVEYYRARARGGVGMVIAEITFMDDLGSRAFHAQLGAHNDLMIPGLSDLAEAIKAEGAVAGLQLGHCGSQRVIPDPPMLAPSPIPWMEGKRVPSEMTLDEITQLVEDHRQAARRLVQAGFDLIELHAAHGYLLNTFLSPATNVRTDAYGGSFEARMRFPLEVVRAVREQLGPHRLLCVRLNGEDFLPGGLDVTSYGQVARGLAESGVDLIHVSAGTYRAMEKRVLPMYLEEGPFVGYARPIREAAGIPVIASCAIHDPDLAESIVADGRADFVSHARPQFADPQLADKLLSGRVDEIRPCIRCNTCLHREQSGARALCAINPRTGREGEAIVPARRARRVLVAGAGPAGIQCALSSAARGHEVHLHDASHLVGGQLRIAAGLPFKRTLPRLLRWYESELGRAGVRVQLGSRIGPADVDADALVVATGARWPVPAPVPGGPRMLDVLSALALPPQPGAPVLILGAGKRGAEAAWHLAQTGHRVMLADPAADYGEDLNIVDRLVVPRELQQHQVELLFGHALHSVAPGGAVLSGTGGVTVQRMADLIVFALPEEPEPGAARQPWLRDGLEVHAIGECSGAAGIIGATHAGHRVAGLL